MTVIAGPTAPQRGVGADQEWDENPVVALRLSMGLSRRAFCLQYGGGYQMWQNIETGQTRTLSPAACKAIRAAGADPDKLARDLLAWRNSHRVA